MKLFSTILFIVTADDGLLLNIHHTYLDSTVFHGYRRMGDGSLGQAEIKQVARNSGDIIAAVNGASVVGKHFDEVVSIFKDAKRYSDKVDVLFHAQL